MMEIIIYKSVYGTIWLKGGCFGNTCLQAVETQKPFSSRPINNNDYKMFRPINSNGGRRGRDRMVVGFTIIHAISAYHH